MQPQSGSNIAGDRERIARIAFILWEQAGRPPGRDLEFWLSAERQVGAANAAMIDRARVAPPQAKVAAVTVNHPSGRTEIVRADSMGARRPQARSRGGRGPKAAGRLSRMRAKGALSSLGNRPR